MGTSGERAPESGVGQSAGLRIDLDRLTAAQGIHGLDHGVAALFQSGRGRRRNPPLHFDIA